MIRTITATLLGLCLLAGPASASTTTKGKLYTSMTGADTAALLERHGHTVTQKVSQSGAPIHTFELNGVRTSLYHFNCGEDGECSSIQLYVGLGMENKPSVQLINTWNQSYRLTRAYIDDVGDPCLEADLSLKGGTSKQAIIEMLEMFEHSTQKYMEHVGFSR